MKRGPGNKTKAALPTDRSCAGIHAAENPVRLSNVQGSCPGIREFMVFTVFTRKLKKSFLRNYHLKIKEKSWIT